jgi:transcription-repair coupling factor (superfamily II helicase)
LAQLHQLRGRVGRGSRRGFAHFLFDPGVKSAAAAVKRLQVLAENSGLAAGFAVSERDMDLRGGGSLLGEQQAGHVKLVGPELYRHLLERAILSAHGEQPPDEELPALHLEVSGAIPLDYVGDEGLRLELYARIAKAGSERAIEEIESELEDGFGPIPTEVCELIAIARIRLLCRQLRVSRIDAGPQAIALSFRSRRRAATMELDSGLRWHKERLIYPKQTERDQRIATITELLEKLNSSQGTSRRFPLSDITASSTFALGHSDSQSR